MQHGASNMLKLGELEGYEDKSESAENKTTLAIINTSTSIFLRGAKYMK